MPQFCWSVGKCVCRIFYRELSDHCFAVIPFTQSGQEDVADVVEVANLASVLLADPIPTAVLREKQAPSIVSRHCMDQSQRQFERLSANRVERDPRPEFRHLLVDS